MDILIVSQYLRDIESLNGNNSRFIYLAKMLGADKKNNIEIITSNFSHGKKRRFKKIDQSEFFKITAFEEPGYPKNVCLSRFYSHAILAKNIGKYLVGRKTPDCIYCAVPSLDVAKVIAEYCKCNRVRFIIDIQDLWPEAFKMVFNIPFISNLFFLPVERIANQIYEQADEIVAVSKTYCKRAMQVNKKADEAHTVFLGTKLEDFDNNAKKECPVKLDSERIKLAYCGTLGSSYDLTCVIDALDIMNQKCAETPLFVVMGDGPRKDEFRDYAHKKNVDTLFTGRLDYGDMCAALCKCDMVVNPITKGAAQSIINKHADYAASGLPVLNTQECQEYRDLVDEYNMGFNCVNNDAYDLAEKIMLLINDAELRSRMGKNARKCAEGRFDRKYTYEKIVEIINKG